MSPINRKLSNLSRILLGLKKRVMSNQPHMELNNFKIWKRIKTDRVKTQTLNTNNTTMSLLIPTKLPTIPPIQLPFRRSSQVINIVLIQPLEQLSVIPAYTNQITYYTAYT